MDKSKPVPAAPNSAVQRITVDRNIMGEYCVELEKRFADEMKKVNGAVLLDLSRVTLMDSRGIALCVGLFKECRNRNFAFSMEVSPQLDRFFRLLKLDKVLNFKEAGGAA